VTAQDLVERDQEQAVREVVVRAQDQGHIQEMVWVEEWVGVEADGKEYTCNNGGRDV